MLLPIVGFVAGAGALQLQAQLPAREDALLLCVPLLAKLIAVRYRIDSLRLNLIVDCVLGLAAGFAWAALCAGLRLADALPHEWEARDVRVTGVVARLAQPFERGVRFEFDVEQVSPAQARVPRRIVLSWYGFSRHGDAAGPRVQAGERWQFVVRLRRPHGTANPHGFDYEAWLIERGIRATGYVRLEAPGARQADFVPHPIYAIERLRARIRSRILDVIGGEPYAGVIVALVMGDQRAIGRDQWTVFTRTGVNHLMSISGLHVTMIAAFVFSIAGALWRRIPGLLERCAARHAATLAGLVAAFCYCAIAGFAVPAQRTVYMLAVVAVALWSGQVSAARHILALALLVVTVLDPWAVLAPGFWLSFGAVAVIFYVGTGTVRPSHWAVAWLRMQWAVTLGLIPILLAMFQQVSLVSPLANAFAIPVVSLAIVPLALIATAVPFDFLLQLAHALVEVTMFALQWLAALPASVWVQHAPPPWAVAVALCGIAWLLLPRGFPARWIGAIGLLPLFTVVPHGPPPGEIRLTVLDVGQGLAVVVRTHRHALLYDAGPQYSADADSGSRIVVPYLRASGITRLHGVILTHADNDHAGGARAVLDAVPVDWLASSLPASSDLHAAPRRSMPCYDGQRWVWDGVLFEILHPRIESYRAERLKANDRSCVLRITAAATRVLLTGDIEAKSERELVEREGDRLSAQIMVVPHHGSTTSSTTEFVAAVAPRVAIFTVGYRNRFGHPRPEVLQRYEQRGSRILRSDRHGAVLVAIDTGGTSIRLQRELKRRYWQDPLERGGAQPDDR